MLNVTDTRTHYPAHYRSRFCNTSRRTPSLVLRVSLLITLLITPITAQETKRGTRDELISAARQIMNTSRYCALITTDAKGSVQARTMDAFAPDENMIVWLATN